MCRDTGLRVRAECVFCRRPRSSPRHGAPCPYTWPAPVQDTVQQYSFTDSNGKANLVILSAAKNPLGWVQDGPQAFARRGEMLSVD